MRTHHLVLAVACARCGALSYLDANPRAAAKAKAAALVDGLASRKGPLPDPPKLKADAVDWSELPEDFLPARREREDEQRRSRASIEALATVARRLRGSGRVVDPCAGRGDLVLPLMTLLDAPALAGDISAGALEVAAERAAEAGVALETRAADAAELALEPADCVVALRACGAIADLVIKAAVAKDCAFVVSPCCLWKALQDRGSTSNGRMPAFPAARPALLTYPRSEWLSDVDEADYRLLVDADDPPTARASAMLGDGSRTTLFRRARRILEEDRLKYAEERGYVTRLLRFEGGDNPHTGILCGAPAGSEASFALVTLDVDAHKGEALFPED